MSQIESICIVQQHTSVSIFITEHGTHGSLQHYNPLILYKMDLLNLYSPLFLHIATVSTVMIQVQPLVCNQLQSLRMLQQVLGIV